MDKTHALYFVIGFIVYNVIMIGIGIWYSHGKNTGKGYLTGGSNLSTFLVFATMGATLIGTGSSIGATANGFRVGWGGSAYGLGACLGVFLLVFIMYRGRIRTKGFITMAEEAQYHFDGNLKMKNVMAVMMMIIEIIWLGNHMNGGATYLAYITGLDPVLSRAIMGVIFGVYVIIGGLLAVVITDAIQLMILCLGFVVITLVAIPAAGGWDLISATIRESGNAGNLTFYGVGTLGVMGLISLIYTVGIPALGTPTYRMRWYYSKDDMAARKAMTRSGILLFVFSLVPAIIGMAAFTIAYNSNAEAVLKTPDFAFTYMATQVLGPLLGMLFMVAGLSATMSSGDSDAIACVTIFIQDIYPMITGKELEERRVPTWSRIGVCVTLFCAFIATLFARDVLGYISNVIGSIIPGVSVAMFLGALWKRVTWQGGLASIFSGLIFGILFLGYTPFNQWVIASFTGPAIPASIVALVCGVVCSLITAPPTKTEEERMAAVLAARGKNIEVGH
ncbi:MAG: sodium:solute symporter family protein [Planctomycetes bacterium]|nr:sodium:solute symporter family protein [Planctomycetota bacterium]